VKVTYDAAMPLDVTHKGACASWHDEEVWFVRVSIASTLPSTASRCAEAARSGLRGVSLLYSDAPMLSIAIVIALRKDYGEIFGVPLYDELASSTCVCQPEDMIKPHIVHPQPRDTQSLTRWRIHALVVLDVPSIPRPRDDDGRRASGPAAGHRRGPQGPPRLLDGLGHRPAPERATGPQRGRRESGWMGGPPAGDTEAGSC